MSRVEMTGVSEFSIRGMGGWRDRLSLVGLCVFVVFLAVGIISGLLFRGNNYDSGAAAANITVIDNDQTMEVDQATGEVIIRKTSEVRVTDPLASTGYLLSANINQNGIAGATVTIGSDDPAALHCSKESPCELDPGGAELPILYPENNQDATVQNGDTSLWEITISIPPNTAVGDYMVDIAYSEQPVTPMQALAYDNCTEQRSIAYDARNGQAYYVQRIAGLCWMETNLRYGGDGKYDSVWGWEDDRYASTATNDTTTTNDDTYPLIDADQTPNGYTHYDAMVADPGGSTNYTNTSPGEVDSDWVGLPSTYGFYGYLYNWCAAMRGQAGACDEVSMPDLDASASICPAGWRLPTGGIGDGEGENASPTYTEFGRLNNAINEGRTYEVNSEDELVPGMDVGLRENFLGVYSGGYILYPSGANGVYWSSSPAGSTGGAFMLYFSDEYVLPGTQNESTAFAMGVRCVLPPTLEDMTYMQDLALPENENVCTDTADRTRVVLKDRRNGQDYFVEKIGDLCWMETNLRYGGDGSWNNSLGYADDRYATNAINDTAGTNDDSRPLLMTSSGYFGGSSSASGQVAGVADAGGTTALDTTLPTNYSNNATFYGYLYNWCAAMGGQQDACVNSPPLSDFDADTSICPAGWRLPTGGSMATDDNEFYSLVVAVNDGAADTDQGLIVNFLAVYSGFYGSFPEYQGSGGFLWSSTNSGWTYPYYLEYGPSYVEYNTASVSSSSGFSVRCVVE